jgi:hypothetical protein
LGFLSSLALVFAKGRWWVCIAGAS